MEKDKAIAQQLREMNVGEEIHFPLTQYGSVSNSRYRELVIDRANGAKWKINPDMKKKVTVVRRLA